LLARVRAVLRRKIGADAENPSVFSFGDVEVDLIKRQVRKSGAEVHLTALEYRLLSTMISNAGRVLTHRQILHEVWGPSYARRSTTSAFTWAICVASSRTMPPSRSTW
jgi:two-component system KDP operon response regulator KdpE